jgi:NADPH:quinone reductase-like Zn-dependent oxidoreductase
VGGVGSLACQMAKNIFGAAKVITTVSTEKVGKVDKLCHVLRTGHT